MLLTQRHVQDRVKLDTQAKLVVVDESWDNAISQQPTSNPDVQQDPDRLMYMIFTSGEPAQILHCCLACACGRQYEQHWDVSTKRKGRQLSHGLTPDSHPLGLALLLYLALSHGIAPSVQSCTCCGCLVTVQCMLHTSISAHACF